MAKTEDKTNVMRILDAKKIKYLSYEYDNSRAMSGDEIAEILGKDPATVFKTLVTVGKSGNHYVFDVPVLCELDLKKAAAAVGEKSVEMIRQAELLPLTGYIHGGCSPIGMKKFFRTTFHATAETLDTLCFSAGKIGRQVEMAPEELMKVIRFSYADIIKDNR
ncbi:MAG: Cys-tRNA(Pro) deacylase [Clostridia bacterium]|nr:Cys-tRNA(Pro) deacylase [Clostridia bacterium]